MTLKLEVGKFYKRSDGAKVYIHHKKNTDYLGVIVGVGGAFLFKSGGVHRCGNLISEWPSNDPLDKFTVGSKWLSEGGNLITIMRRQVRYDFSPEEPDFSYFHSDSEYAASLTPQGKQLSSDEISLEDMIEVWSIEDNEGMYTLADIFQALAKEIKELKEKAGG